MLVLITLQYTEKKNGSLEDNPIHWIISLRGKEEIQEQLSINTFIQAAEGDQSI